MKENSINNVKDALLSKKFLITLVIFFAWIALFDSSSILDRIRLKRELNKLVSEKEFYIKKIKEDSISLIELKTNNDNLEKFAREKYLMKKNNEDIFIIKKEKKDN
ncbi:MAG: septum formation inhibitor [Bacteroidales bacterium]|nr:septum formation inhibitor [Bacteroidales bacterium]MBN2758668.1 septum formation inhibitor [Bacteroidales bacterium]